MKLKKHAVKDNRIEEKDVTETPIAEPSAKTGLRIAKIVLNTVINIMIVLVLITSLLIAIMALTSKRSGVSTVFGRTIQTIQSDSMKGDSPEGFEKCDIQHGDLVLGWATYSDDYAEFDIGDVVTFKENDTDGKKVLVAHRIVDKVMNDDGHYRYQTWGDNREVSQAPDQQSVDEYIGAFDIVSVISNKEHKTTVIHGAGGFLDYIRTSKGFFVVVLIPMIIFFLYAIMRVIINTMNYRKAKADEAAENAEKNKQAEIDAAVKAALEAAGVKSNDDNAVSDAAESAADEE